MPLGALMIGVLSGLTCTGGAAAAGAGPWALAAYPLGGVLGTGAALAWALHRLEAEEGRDAGGDTIRIAAE
ncbi:hypothetical protein [Jannaschia sp. LMIT008]|uniref:hypothetical protein n=1 Tax=Jannaschia maritima TaxID=3032585 RepID=UPI002810FD79|nr:hypothetical protein [Jannaschia sp. LMIT008]